MAVFTRRSPPPKTAPPVDPTCGDPRVGEFVDALRWSDWRTAEAMVDGLSSRYEREFFVGRVGEVSGRPPGFDEWVAERPDSASAHLVRGAHSVCWAWEARGHGRAGTVGDDAWPRFFERLRAAEADLQRATELDPQDPVPWVHLATTARGLEIPKEELRWRFEEGNRRAPQLVGLHSTVLQGLCAKWGGSDEEMLAFARGAAGAAPLGSPLHALIVIAHFEAGVDHQPAYFRRPDVRHEFQVAADRSVFHPAWADNPYTVTALNEFAFGFALLGDLDRARSLGARIGSRRTAHPWDCFHEPDAQFAKIVPRAAG